MQARQCFQNAENSVNADLAMAHMYQKEGREQRALGLEGFSELFCEAGRIFEKHERFSQCTDCFEAAGEFAKAARKWKD